MQCVHILLVLLATYLHAYTFISVTVTLALSLLGGMKLVRMDMKDATFSTILSVSQPSPSTGHSTFVPPIKVKQSTKESKEILSI